MALLAQRLPDAHVVAYEGEDAATTIQFPDGSRRWIQAESYDELNDYTEGFTPQEG